MFIYTNMCKTFSIAWIPVKAKGHRQRHLRHYLCSQLARAEVLLNYLIIYYYLIILGTMTLVLVGMDNF